MSFYDYRTFPIVSQLVDVIRDVLPLVFREGVGALDLFSPSPEVYIQDPNDIRLMILPVKWQGKMVDAAEFSGDRAHAWKPAATGQQILEAVPTLARLVRQSFVTNAMYSMSRPGCEIVPHIDREEAIGEVLRLHIGLTCPPGDCALIVDGERREWQDGEALLFDSARVTHSAHNRTERPRMILILDLDRKALGVA